MAGMKKRLRLLTYMVPEIHISIFNLIRDRIEEVTGMEVDIICEDRYLGPPPERTNPFDANLADMLFVHSSDYLRLKANGQNYMELFPAAISHTHPMSEGRPVYFSEIIVHSINKEKYKSFKDLKGCSWAYRDEQSLSANQIVLNYLKKTHGTDASYFGTSIHSGSHLKSIEMVREHQVQAAAVDSVVLASYLRDHSVQESEFHSVVTLGPLPVYPILINSRMSGALKQELSKALLEMHKITLWEKRLKACGVDKFVPADESLYHLEKDITDNVKGMSINNRYY